MSSGDRRSTSTALGAAGIATCLILAVALLQQFAHSRRVEEGQRELRQGLVDLNRVARDARFEVSALSQRVDQHDLVLGDLESKLAELSARMDRSMTDLPTTRENAAGEESVTPSDPGPSPTSEDPTTDLARSQEIAALEASRYPLVLYEDLPERARAAFLNWKNRALFIEYPENRWGTRKFGRIGIMRKDEEFGWGWEYLDENNTPTIRRLAELTYDMYAEIERNTELAFESGLGRRFASSREALDFIRNLAKPTKGPGMRVDPATGEAYVFPWETIHTPRVQELLEARNQLGKDLLDGGSGSVGSGWVDAE